MDKKIPVIPKLPDDIVDPRHPGPADPNPVVAICGECGLAITQVMGYVCGNARCPAGFGGSRC